MLHFTSAALFFFFFFNDPATTEIYTLSLHDALPISDGDAGVPRVQDKVLEGTERGVAFARIRRFARSEEHTSELQSRGHLVCRLLLEKKKKNSKTWKIELTSCSKLLD